MKMKPTYQYSSLLSSWFQRVQCWMCFPVLAHLLLKSAQDMGKKKWGFKTPCFLASVFQLWVRGGSAIQGKVRLSVSAYCYWISISWWTLLKECERECVCVYQRACSVCQRVCVQVCVYIYTPNFVVSKLSNKSSESAALHCFPKHHLLQCL